MSWATFGRCFKKLIWSPCSSALAPFLWRIYFFVFSATQVPLLTGCIWTRLEKKIEIWSGCCLSFSSKEATVIGNGSERRRCHKITKTWPGAYPTKHNFSTFTHICKIFSQIGMRNFFTNLWKIEPTKICINIFKFCLVYFTIVLQQNWHKMIVKILSCQKIAVKSYKYIKCEIFGITKILVG
jgi:hypothetical protein